MYLKFNTNQSAPPQSSAGQTIQPDNTRLESKDFFEAAKNGNLDIVNQCINEQKTNHKKINVQDEQGNSALLLAASAGHLAIVNSLLEVAGIAINLTNKFGDTPLIEAARNGHEAVVEELTKQADLNHRNMQGLTAANEAQVNGHTRILWRLQAHSLFRLVVEAKNDVTAIEQYLAENNPISPKVINARADDGTTLLGFAAHRGKRAVVMCLLKLPGIHVNAENDNGDTPLTLAVNGADLLQKKQAENTAASLASVYIWWGQPAIALLRMATLAISNNNLQLIQDLIQDLIDHGADLLHKNKAGYTAASLAPLYIGSGSPTTSLLRRATFFQTIKTGDLSAIEQIIQENRNWPAILNAIINAFGDTALIWAARNGQRNIVMLLLRAGADISLRNSVQKTAVDEARQNGHLDILKLFHSGAHFLDAVLLGDLAFVKGYLIDHPEAATYCDPCGNSALILAATYDRLYIMHLLLKQGGSCINEANCNDDTALIWVANSKNLEQGEKLAVVNAFLRMPGIEFDKANNKGNTALIAAASLGSPAVVQALLTKGADLYHANNAQKTPMDCALASKSPRRPKVVALLKMAQSEDLLKAVSTNNLERVHKYVAESRKNRNLCKVVNEDGDTPLLLAVRKGNLNIVRILVTVACFINATNKMGENALSYAVNNGNWDMVLVLLDAPGSQIEIVEQVSKFNDTTILMVESLLKTGANPGLQNIQITAADLLKLEALKNAAAEEKMARFLKRQLAAKVETIIQPCESSYDGYINPALKIFGTKQNKMANERWEIFILLKNEDGEVGMRSGVKSETDGYNNLRVTSQFDFSMFKSMSADDVRNRLGYRNGHPTLALDFKKLDKDQYDTLPVFSGGWLLRNDSGALKRIQVYWSSGRYSAGRAFSADQTGLLQLCTAYHLMMEYGKDFIVEFYHHADISISKYMTNKAKGGMSYHWEYLIQAVSQLMPGEKQNNSTPVVGSF